MPDKRISKPFNLHANPDQEQIRDKDNAHPKLQPKHLPITPARNLAPLGMLGIRRGLLSNNRQPEAAKRFTIKKAGDLSKKFKPIASKSPNKNKDRER